MVFHSSLLLVRGLIGITVGALGFIWPGLTIAALVIGAWAMVTGVFEIFAAIKLRKEIAGEWLLMLSGAVLVALAVRRKTHHALSHA